MLKVKSQPYNSVWISADSQEALGNTFIRFQEYYESPNINFRQKIFTVGQVRHWYSIQYGANTYHQDWTGFNFPSKVLVPFKQGLFDPLTSEEKELLNLFKYRHDDFYIIGAQNQSVLRHELAHALYLHNESYAKKINNVLDTNRKKMNKVRKYIVEKGYDPSVVNDELQAYITDNDDEFIIKYTPRSIIDKINRIYEAHK